MINTIKYQINKNIGNTIAILLALIIAYIITSFVAKFTSVCNWNERFCLNNDGTLNSWNRQIPFSCEIACTNQEFVIKTIETFFMKGLFILYLISFLLFYFLIQSIVRKINSLN